MDSQKIIDAVLSGVPAVNLISTEHLRADALIAAVAEELNFSIREWNFGYGWVDFKNKRPLNNGGKNIVLFDDLIQLDDLDYETSNMCIVIKNADTTLVENKQAIARIQHQLLRIQRRFRSKAVVILCSSAQMELPELHGLFISHTYAPPQNEEVTLLVEGFIASNGVLVDTKTKNDLISTILGMDKETVIQLLLRNLNRFGKRWLSDILKLAREEKERFVAQSGVVDLIHLCENISDVGGLDNLKNWLRKKKRILDKYSSAQRFGIAPPKGILLAGMPGCGKSLTAKATASLFQLPLLRLDIGSLMGKYVGESEANMKKALKIAEQVSPCVLWIDELEKAFSGLNGAGGGAEVTTRLFGYFLTWMQEKPATVFVIATANDVTQLPPELLRKGRFDEVFYVDLPNMRERESIYKVHLTRINQLKNSINCNELAKKSDGYSGADIQAVLNNALEVAFISNRSELTQQSIQKAISSFVPISAVLKEKIQEYQRLFEQFKLTPASLSDSEIEQFESNSVSKDPSLREEAAESEDISSDELSLLATDTDDGVRRAALKNPNCPEKVLLELIDLYSASRNFSRRQVWSDSGVSEEDFQRALFHPSMSSSSLLDLFCSKKISENTLCCLAYKLNISDQKMLFEKVIIKLPSAIESGTIRVIHVSENDQVTETTRAIELDGKDGTTKEISTSVRGVVSDICSQTGQIVRTGDVLLKVLRLKKTYK